MKKHLYVILNMRLFDAGAAGATGDAGAPSEAAPHAQAAKEPDTVVTTEAETARKAEFNKLIKGDYRDLYDADVQGHIKARLKDFKALEAQVERSKAYSPVLDMLASKYGVDGGDAEAILKALDEDSSFFEDEAFKRGLTVEQFKEFRKMERENAAFKQAEQETLRRQNADRIYAQWQEQSEGCKQFYPNFELQAECSNAETGERFLKLLTSGVDVKTAFEVIHKDDILGGAMQHTAQVVQQKTINDIRARGMRPVENGGSGNGATTPGKIDVANSTKKQREEWAKQAINGGRVTFSQ